MGKDSFILYDNYDEQIQFMTDEQAGLLLKAIYAYRNGRTLPQMDVGVNMAFSFIRGQLDRDNNRYAEICEKRRAAGSMGGAPKGNQNANKQNKQMIANDSKCYQNKQMQAKQADNDNEDEYEYENEDDDIILSQKLFFEKYPAVKIDNYSAAEYAGIDFDLLIKAFDESKYLRVGCTSFKWICSKYHEIIGGGYRDYNADEKAAAPKYYSSNVQSWQGD